VLKQIEGDAFPVLRIKEGGTDSQDRLITRVYALRPRQIRRLSGR
jgi:hypothetical protein